MRKIAKRTLIAYTAMTILVALTGCGDVTINGTINYDDGQSDSQLFAGTCGTWDIAGRYDIGLVNGRCQIQLKCGSTFEFEQSDFLDGDFSTTQKLYGQWVHNRDSTCGTEAMDPYDMCEVRDLGDKVQVDCYNTSFDLVR
jgi:hypothetical protein